MKKETARWAPGLVCREKQRVNVGGVNPWEHEWTRLDKSPIEMPHPSYAHQRHKLRLYKVAGGDREFIFAAGELSPNVWGFYQKLN